VACVLYSLIGVVSMSDNDFNIYNNFNFTLITAIQLYGSESYMSGIHRHNTLNVWANFIFPVVVFERFGLVSLL
jgi:hypothetical protein